MQQHYWMQLLTEVCEQSKIHRFMHGHVAGAGMKQNHPQPMTVLPERLGQTYT